MKKTTLTAAFLLISFCFFAQNIHYQWVKQYEYLPNNLIFDANQNPVFTTTPSDTLFFEGDTFPPSSLQYNSEIGLYLKFDKNGNYSDYMRFPYTSWGYGIDSENNYYFTAGPHGYYLDTLYIGNDSIVLDNNDSVRCYVVQYDSIGNYNWHKKIYATEYLTQCVHTYDGITDMQDNFYVHGGGNYLRFETDTAFSYKKFTGLFIAKYYKDGSLKWAKQLGGSIINLQTDHNNDLFVYGSSSIDTILIENDTLLEAYGDKFLAKYSSTGDLLWYHQYDLSISDVHVSRTDGSIFISGRVNNDTLFIGTDTIDFPLFTQSYNGQYSYIAKFSNDGTYEWVQIITGYKLNFYSNSTITKSDGSIIICGHFQDSVIIDNIKFYQDTNYNFGAMFLAMLNPNGNAELIKVYDAYLPDVLRHLQIDNNDNIYLAYNPGADYINGDTIYYNQFEEIFTENTVVFLKLNAWNTFVDNVEYSDIVSIYPNPGNGIISVRLPSTEQEYPTDIKIYDINGHSVYSGTTNQNEFNLNIQNEPPGIYLIHFNNENFREVHKIIKQ